MKQGQLLRDAFIGASQFRQCVVVVADRDDFTYRKREPYFGTEALFQIQEVSGSNLGPETGYPD